MPKYTFSLPTGESYTVESPTELSDAELSSIINQNSASLAKPKAASRLAPPPGMTYPKGRLRTVDPNTIGTPSAPSKSLAGTWFDTPKVPVDNSALFPKAQPAASIPTIQGLAQEQAAINDRKAMQAQIDAINDVERFRGADPNADPSMAYATNYGRTPAPQTRAANSLLTDINKAAEKAYKGAQKTVGGVVASGFDPKVQEAIGTWALNLTGVGENPLDTSLGLALGALGGVGHALADALKAGDAKAWLKFGRSVDSLTLPEATKDALKSAAREEFGVKAPETGGNPNGKATQETVNAQAGQRGTLQEADLGPRVQGSEGPQSTGGVDRAQEVRGGEVQQPVQKGQEVTPPATEGQKQPWQMTREEFIAANPQMSPQDAQQFHVGQVQGAAASGKPIPPEVLKDFPYIKPKEAPRPVDAVPPATEGQTVPQTATEPVPKPQEVTGISNRMQADDVESGRLTAPEMGERPSKPVMQEEAKGTTLATANTLAEQIANKTAPFDSKAVAIAKEGDRLHRLEVNSARDALDEALANGDPADIQVKQKAYDAARENHQKYVDNIQKGKTEWHNTGRALQDGIDLDTGDYAQVVQEATRRKGGAITPDVEAKLKSLTDEVAKQQARAEQAEADLAKMQAQGVVQRQSSRRVARDTATILADRERLKKELLREAATLNAGINPEALKKLGQYAMTYVEEGVGKLEDLVAKVKADFPDIAERDIIKAIGYTEKKELPTQSELRQRIADVRKQAKTSDELSKLEEQLRTGNFKEFQDAAEASRMKKDAALARKSAELKDAQAKLNRARSAVRDAIEQQKPKTFGQKAVSAVRTNALTSPGTFTKLAAATVGHAAVAGPEEALTFIGRMVKNSGTEGQYGGFLNFVKAFANPETYAEAMEKLKTGYNRMDAAARAAGYGKGEGENINAILRFAQNSHGAMKTPLQRASYEMEYAKVMRQGLKQGADIAAPEFQLDAAMKAYAKSKQTILMNDSAASDAVSRMMNANPVTRTVGRVFMPIAKVPMNYGGRVGEYIAGIPYGAFKQIQAAVTKDVSAETAGAIARAYKRGGVGLALIAAGVYSSDTVKVDDNGHLIVNGHPLGSAVSHIPWLEAFKMGVEYRQSRDLSKTAFQTTRNVARGLPMVDFAQEIGTAMEGEKSAGKSAGALIGQFTKPQLMQQMTRAFDTGGKPFDAKTAFARLFGLEPSVSRKASGFTQEMKYGVPGLHQQLPMVTPKH